MCITTLQADLSRTIIGVWDIRHPKWGYRHVLAYQNAVQNLGRGPNCMLLHIPASEPIEPEHIVDTSAPEVRDFLTQMAASRLRFGGSRGLAARENHVVEMGVYHIAVLNDPKAYQEVLEEIPARKRPNIPPEYIYFYLKIFPGYPLLLCCFDNAVQVQSSPIMVHYAPHDPDLFQFPLLEGHGAAPKLGAAVFSERLLVTGSYALEKAHYEKRFFPFDNQVLPEFLPKIGLVFDIRVPPSPNAIKQPIGIPAPPDFNSPLTGLYLSAPFPNLDFIVKRSALLKYDIHGIFTLQPLYGSPNPFLEEFKVSLPPPPPSDFRDEDFDPFFGENPGDF